MKLHLTTLLACPSCRSDLAYESLQDHPREGEEIEEGALACRKCRRQYPIRDGIPELYPPEELDARVLKTAESFGWEWLRYPGSRPEDRGLFLEETQLAEEEWEGRVVLDAGCGMGRYTRVALSLGAEVVSFDLSESILRLLPEARENPKLHLVRGNLLSPPFKRGIFDTVYSQGVIHHTSNTREAFDKIAPLVKEAGRLSVWVYGTAGSYASFSTNPIRSTRVGLKSILPAVWLLVWIRQFLSDFLRIFTTRIPVRLLYALCYPLTVLGAIPGLKYLTFSVEPKFGIRLTENFDWLAPPFQTKHTKEEVRGWFEEAGYAVLKHLPHGVVPKVGILGIKKGK